MKKIALIRTILSVWDEGIESHSQDIFPLVLNGRPYDLHEEISLNLECQEEKIWELTELKKPTSGAIKYYEVVAEWWAEWHTYQGPEDAWPETECDWELREVQTYEIVDREDQTFWEEEKSCNKPNQSFLANGNNGGDFIEMTQTPKQAREEVVNLKVGHCCVQIVQEQVPVSYLTSLFDYILNKEIKPYEIIQYPNKYKNKLMTKFKKLKY